MIVDWWTAALVVEWSGLNCPSFLSVRPSPFLGSGPFALLYTFQVPKICATEQIVSLFITGPSGPPSGQLEGSQGSWKGQSARPAGEV